jgi:hypothetical protein
VIASPTIDPPESAALMSESYVAPSNPISRAGAGVVSGIAGGIVLGLALTMFGHIRAIGDLVGKPSIEVGWTVLLIICAVAGAAYGAFAGRSVSAQIVPAIGIGIAYGGLWWLLLQLIAVPLRQGNGIFDFPNDSMTVLAAYVVFGVVLGLVYAMTGPKRRVPYRRSQSAAAGYMYALPQRIPRPRRRRRRSNQ